MKKTVITTLLAAALSAPLLASAQMTLSGKISIWGDTTKSGSVTTHNLVTEPTSNITVNVSQRIGAVTARSIVETSLRGNTDRGDSTKLGDRQMTVGLSTSIGSLDVGRASHSHFLAISNADVFGTMYGSIAGDVHDLRSTRINNGIYSQLSLIKGVNMRVDRGSNSVAAYSIGTNLYGIVVNAARWNDSNDVSNLLTLQTKIAGFGVSWIHSDDTTKGIKTVGDTFGVSRSMDYITLKGSWGRTDRDMTALAVGADYALNKNTSVGAAYRKIDRAGSVGDVASVGLGLTHKF